MLMDELRRVASVMALWEIQMKMEAEQRTMVTADRTMK
jgi:hypothetical protein